MRSKTFEMLRRRKSELENEIRLLQGELSQVDQFLETFEQPAPKEESVATDGKPATKKDCIINILKESYRGLESREIIAKLDELGMPTSLSNVSSILSRMAKAEELEKRISNGVYYWSIPHKKTGSESA